MKHCWSCAKRNSCPNKVKRKRNPPLFNGFHNYRRKYIMQKEYTEILKENFDKIAAYIKLKYPHAIELSYDKDITCDSPHHVYYTSYIVLSKGDVQYHFGSHGRSQDDVIYSADQRTWVSSTKQKDTRLEDLILEWNTQKMYIDRTLSQYENVFDFKV